nr:glycosyltransferase family 4 protein [Chromobacterium sp. ASV5]
MTALSRPGLKILWTLPYLPWPTTSGGKLRQYHLLRELAARGHRITLLAQSKEAASAECRRQLEDIVERLIVLPRRALKHPLTLLAAALGPHPLLVSVNGLSPALRDAFEALLQEPWDVVQIEHSYGLQPFLPALRRSGQPFVLTEHNVESTLGAATYQHLPAWAAPYIAWDQWRYQRWEKKALAAATRLAAVTDDDALQLARIRRGPVDVVINGVDTAAFAASGPAQDSRRLLFVGNFEYPPNLDAVEWIVEDILPRLWRRMPDARLAVCGYAMPAAWSRRWPDARIEWRGFAPSLPPEQRRSAAFIAALREGGGSKLKVLEALAAGLPLVSTRQGVSGLALQAGRDFLPGDDSQGLADAAWTALQGGERIAELGEAGRRYARDHHDWSVAADQLENLYRKLKHAHRD